MRQEMTRAQLIQYLTAIRNDPGRASALATVDNVLGIMTSTNAQGIKYVAHGTLLPGMDLTKSSTADGSGAST
jgi:hypothetical protein